MSDPRNFIEQYAAITRKMVTDSGAVVLHAANELDNGTHGADEFANSMIRLSDIAFMGGLEIAQLMAACQDAPTAPGTVASPASALPDGRFERRLAVGVSFTRLGSNTIIPDDRITFDPPVLGRLEGAFRVIVNRTGLPRAHYRGKVRLIPTDPAGQAHAFTEVDHVIRL